MVKSSKELRKSPQAALYGATSKMTDPKMLGEIYMRFLDISMSVSIENALYGFN